MTQFLRKLPDSDAKNTIMQFLEISDCQNVQAIAEETKKYLISILHHVIKTSTEKLNQPDSDEEVDDLTDEQI